MGAHPSMVWRAKGLTRLVQDKSIIWACHVIVKTPKACP
jgi:hypothetical protein